MGIFKKAKCVKAFLNTKTSLKESLPYLKFKTTLQILSINKREDSEDNDLKMLENIMEENKEAMERLANE